MASNRSKTRLTWANKNARLSFIAGIATLNTFFLPVREDGSSILGVVEATPVKSSKSSSPHRRSILSAAAAASFALTSTATVIPTEACAINVFSATTQSESPVQLLESLRPPKAVPLLVGDWVNRPELKTNLGKARIGTMNPIRPLQQPIFGGEQELYYAPFLFGSWRTTAVLKQKVFPFGTTYLPSKSLLEGSPRNRDEQIGHACSYELHFFSTLANTLSNRIIVNLGTGVPESKVIQDREYNIVSVSNAYEQLAPVQDVLWDYRDNPYELSLTFGAGAVADDMRPLGPRRAKVYLNARACEYGTPGGPGDADPTFCAAERSRLVTLSPGNVVVSDTETITEFTKVSDNLVTGVTRIAVYLVPNPNSREGVLWQQVRGESVAFYDYEIKMRRMVEAFERTDGTVEPRACVKTPKDVVQCS